MKVLADTCVWSLSLRRKNKTALPDDKQRCIDLLTDAIKDGRVVIIGPIRQEILSGIKEPSQYDRIRVALSAFQDEQITTKNYEDAARLFNFCRSRGIDCGPIDMLICAISFEREWLVLSYDQGLKRCIKEIESIRTDL